MTDPRLFKRSSFLLASAALGVSACAEHSNTMVVPALSSNRLNRRFASPMATGSGVTIRIDYSKNQSILYVNSKPIFKNVLGRKGVWVTITYYKGQTKMFKYKVSNNFEHAPRTGQRDQTSSIGLIGEGGLWHAMSTRAAFFTNAKGSEIVRLKPFFQQCPQDGVTTCQTATPPPTIYNTTITPPPRTVVQTIKTFVFQGGGGGGPKATEPPVSRILSCFDSAIAAAGLSPQMKNYQAFQDAIANWIFDTLPIELIPGVDAIYDVVIAGIEMIAAVVGVAVTLEMLRLFADSFSKCLTGKD